MNRQAVAWFLGRALLVVLIAGAVIWALGKWTNFSLGSWKGLPKLPNIGAWLKGDSVPQSSGDAISSSSIDEQMAAVERAQQQQQTAERLRQTALANATGIIIAERSKYNQLMGIPQFGDVLNIAVYVYEKGTFTTADSTVEVRTSGGESHRQTVPAGKAWDVPAVLGVHYTITTKDAEGRSGREDVVFSGLQQRVDVYLK